MSIERLLSGDTVTVTPLEGEGAYGPVYGAARTVDCRVEHERKMVRDADGSEVVAETTIYLLPHLGDDLAVDLFSPGSLVTVDGRQAQVLTCAAHRGLGDAVYVEATTT